MEREQILIRLILVVDELLKTGRVDEARTLLEKFKKVDWNP